MTISRIEFGLASILILMLTVMVNACQMPEQVHSNVKRPYTVEYVGVDGDWAIFECISGSLKGARFVHTKRHNGVARLANLDIALGDTLVVMTTACGNPFAKQP